MKKYGNLIIVEDDDFSSDMKKKRINTPTESTLLIRWYEVLPFQYHIGPANTKILDVYRYPTYSLVERIYPTGSATVDGMAFENNTSPLSVFSTLY